MLGKVEDVKKRERERERERESEPARIASFEYIVGHYKFSSPKIKLFA